VANRHAAKTKPDTPSAEDGVPAQPERLAVAAALRSLPPRQREVLVLRYYAGLPEPQMAAAMGVSRGSVHSHTARAVAALRGVLEMNA
jgi:RNA polymerase sigma factor (sigma-70 family)